eukprot:166419-Prymnesium_polylepis.1
MPPEKTSRSLMAALLLLLLPRAHSRTQICRERPAEMRPAFDTAIPCASASTRSSRYAVNANATLHVTATEPPCTLCLSTELVDNFVKVHGRWHDCDALVQFMETAPSSPMRRIRRLFVDV